MGGFKDYLAYLVESGENIESHFRSAANRGRIVTPFGEKLNIKNLAKFARENGLDQGNLQNTCTGQAKTHKGYRAYHVS